jgi:hypothetical protein
MMSGRREEREEKEGSKEKVSVGGWKKSKRQPDKHSKIIHFEK